jgi:hypothetical protein
MTNGDTPGKLIRAHTSRPSGQHPTQLQIHLWQCEEELEFCKAQKWMERLAIRHPVTGTDLYH